jgi:mxaK protein
MTRPRRPSAGPRPPTFVGKIGRRGRFLVPAALVLSVLAMLCAAALFGSRLAANRRIDALAGGRDIAVAVDARPAEAAARLEFLLQRERFEEAFPLIEHAAAEGDAEVAAGALYNGGNAHLRRALASIADSRFDAATADVNLAKDYYQRALRIDPGFWDAKYNLDVAMRLVRDFPAGAVDDEAPTRQSKRAWTDLPGLPKGGP